MLQVWEEEVVRMAVEVWGPRLRTPFHVCDMVRERPSLYLGTPTVRGLSAFVRAFRLSAAVAGKPLGPGEPPFDAFGDWLAARAGVRGEAPDWATIVGESEPGPRALEAIFAELDAYRSRVGVCVGRADVPPRAGERDWPTGLSLWSYPEDGLAWLRSEPDGRDLRPFRRGVELVQRFAELAYGVTAWTPVGGDGR